MQDKSNIAIGTLSITAVVLFVGVMLSVSRHEQAAAMGVLDRGGDYIVVTGQFSDSNELVYVTDAAAQRMNVYSYEQTVRQFMLWDTVDLRRVFAQATPAP
ncbi:MAG: hypothetical protein HZA51_05055 [Planctomycetes bacterium]|nr:hypothetical protein [Planctomycetota bacterium]